MEEAGRQLPLHQITAVMAPGLKDITLTKCPHGEVWEDKVEEVLEVYWFKQEEEVLEVYWFNQEEEVLEVYWFNQEEEEVPVWIDHSSIPCLELHLASP